MIYHIDLNKFQMRFNRDKEIISLRRKQLNGLRTKNLRRNFIFSFFFLENGEIGTPSSWSSSILMIRTVSLNKSSFQTLECFQIFQKTMSTLEWQIERVNKN